MQVNQQFSVSSKTFVSTLQSFEVRNNNVLSFQEPICGFESIEKYALIPTDKLPSNQGYFMLQSLDGSNVSFIVYAVPFTDLVSELQDKLQIFVEQLGLSPQHVVVAHLVIIDKDKPKGERMSLGRVAPLIFCCQTNSAWQVIVER